jgi:hypothetical protein
MTKDNAIIMTCLMLDLSSESVQYEMPLFSGFLIDITLPFPYIL